MNSSHSRCLDPSRVAAVFVSRPSIRRVLTIPSHLCGGTRERLVLDLFLSGDQYEVFDNGISLGKTSTPGPELQCGLPALGGYYLRPEHGQLQPRHLPAGTGVPFHCLVTTSVNPSGAALQLTPAVPRTAGILFVVTGLAAIALKTSRPQLAGSPAQLCRRDTPPVAQPLTPGPPLPRNSLKRIL